MNKEMRHYENSTSVPTSANELFDYIDDHKLFSSHMNKLSWMMGGGGRMDVSIDEGRGQKVGSHIRMSGRAFGIGLYLDEVVTRYEPPYLKTWKTVGTPKLLIIGHYQKGIEIKPQDNNSHLHVSIDYDLPKKNTWLGKLFSTAYAKWCVQQMIKGVSENFIT